jgi:hypothetical protein
MNNLVLTDGLFDVSEVSSRDGRVHICLSVPMEAYSQIPKVLDALDFFYRLASRQIKVQKAVDSALDPVAIEKRAQNFKSYCDDIFKKYDELVSTGLGRRAVIQKIKSYSTNRGKYITCTSIDILIRQSGRYRRSWVVPSVS